MKKVALMVLVPLGFLLPMLASASPSAPQDVTPPAVLSVHVSSSNPTPSKAAPGDTVALSFTASEKVTPLLLVNTRALIVKAKSSAGNAWDASYSVDKKDPTGKVSYFLTLLDAAGNTFMCSSMRLPMVGYCPPTDDSGVVVVKNTGTMPSALDPVPPAPVPDAATTTDATTTPEAPPPAPGPYVMASQPDESFFCATSWTLCFDVVTNQDDFTSTETINLGEGSSLGSGTIESVVLSRDEHDFNTPRHPWAVTLTCYTDASYTALCPDWVQPIAANGNQTSSITRHAGETLEGKYWTSYFTPGHQADFFVPHNFDGTLPVRFIPNDYYQLTVDDTSWDTAAYGSASLHQLYWVINGVR